MDDRKDNILEKEILSEEYMLGEEYYHKILEKAKKDNKNIEQ